MKQFISVFLIFLFLSFNANIISVFAQPEAKSLTQGLYKIKDVGLLTGSIYNVRNISSTDRVVLIVFDGHEMMQEFMRLEANSPNYSIKPLDFDSIIIIIGHGTIKFS